MVNGCGYCGKDVRKGARGVLGCSGCETVYSHSSCAGVTPAAASVLNDGGNDCLFFCKNCIVDIRVFLKARRVKRVSRSGRGDVTPKSYSQAVTSPCVEKAYASLNVANVRTGGSNKSESISLVEVSLCESEVVETVERNNGEIEIRVRKNGSESVNSETKSVNGGKGGQQICESSKTVELRNRDTVNVNETRQCDITSTKVSELIKSLRSKIEKKQEPSSVAFYGDSMIRGMERNFRDVRGRVVCIPGGKIESVNRALKESVAKDVEVIWVGTNDIGNGGSVALQNSYRELLGEMRARPGRSVLVGVLPRRHSGSEWYSRARQINEWLHAECMKDDKILFLNRFEYFWNRPRFYKRDGVHLTDEGKWEISKLVEEAVCHCLRKPFLG